MIARRQSREGCHKKTSVRKLPQEDHCKNTTVRTTLRKPSRENHCEETTTIKPSRENHRDKTTARKQPRGNHREETTARKQPRGNHRKKPPWDDHHKKASREHCKKQSWVMTERNNCEKMTAKRQCCEIMINTAHDNLSELHKKCLSYTLIF